MGEMSVQLVGASDVDETKDLLKWIKRERIDGIDDIEQVSVPPKEGEMGPSLLAVLGVVLGAKATVELVKSIHKWIETRKRKIKITIEKDGQSITIDCESPESVAEIMDGLKITE